jgi:tetratricopeptide (TPR) repeat protein
MFKITSLLISLLIASAVQANTIKQMKIALDTAQYASAATTGLALLHKQPDNLNVQFLTALALQKNKQTQQAISLYQDIIKAHPELPEPLNNLAIIYLQKGEYDQAIKLLISSLNTHPAYATSYQNLNKIYQGLASEAYRKALSDNSDSSDVLNRIQLSVLDKIQQPALVETSEPAQQPVIAELKPAEENPTSEQQPLATALSPAKTETVKKPQPETDESQHIMQLVKNWANDWSNQQFDQYVDAYDDSYRGRYRNHNEWIKQRRKRIVQRDRITVTLSNLKIQSLNKSRAVIDFHQAYQSPGYRDKVIKRLRLNKVNNRWKINQELTLAVL